jgi:uncharacterized repeat protein (TIGR01451 family)
VPFDFPTTLYAVDATSETDVWVAGGWITGYPYPTCGTDIFHWDGTSWTAMSAPPGIQPHVIDMLSSTEGWAAGGCGYMDAWAFTIYHWDGHVWSSMELPPASPEIVTLSAVSSTDAWAASWHTLWHWDGNAWTAVAPPVPERNANAIEMLSSTEGWAAGDEGVILRFGPYPDLRLDARLEPDPVQANQTLTLTLGVQNDGAGAATGVVLTATLSLSATLTSPPLGCIQQAGVIRCERGDLLPGASDTVTLAVVMDAQATGVLFADVEVAAQEPDPISSNNAQRLLAFINARWDVDLPVTLWR